MQRNEDHDRDEANRAGRRLLGYAPTIAHWAGGAGVGALLMYLLDPSTGSERREYAGDLARGAWRGTGGALQSTWETVKDFGGRAGVATSAGAAAARSAVSRSAERLADTRLARRIGQTADDLREETSDRFDYLFHGRRPRGAGQALAAVGCVALGIGAMYFLDGKEGARRRAVCRDKFASGLGRAATSMRNLGRGFYNRAAGTVHSAGAAMKHEHPDDGVIVERVRSSMGRCVQNVGAVLVESRDGVVTLSGVVMAPEVDDLLKSTWAVRGVRELVNRLEVKSPQTPHASARPTGASAGSLM